MRSTHTRNAHRPAQRDPVAALPVFGSHAAALETMRGICKLASRSSPRPGVLLAVALFAWSACAEDHAPEKADAAPGHSAQSTQEEAGNHAHDAVVDAREAVVAENDAEVALQTDAEAEASVLDGGNTVADADDVLVITPLLDPKVPGLTFIGKPRLREPGYDKGPCASISRPDESTCRWTIPAVVMRGFAPNTARVRYGSSDALTALHYDPNCTADLAWHYVDAAAADEVMLCETTCARLRSEGVRNVQFEYPCTYALL